MTNLSELLPSGGGQNAVEFTASGTLNNGTIVGLKSDGTVAVLDPSTVGSPADFANTSNVAFAAAAYDGIRNVVHIAYRENQSGGYVTHCAGSISGSTITWGTPSTIDTTVAGPKDIDIAFNGSIQFPIVTWCQASGGDLYVKSGTGGSGTNMNWNGNRLLVQSGDNNNCMIAYNPNASNASSAETLLTYNYQGSGTLYVKALTTTNGGITSVKATDYPAYGSDQYLPVGLVKIATSNSFLLVANQVNYTTGAQGCACYQVTIGSTSISYSSAGTIGTGFSITGTACDESLSSNTHRMAADFNQGTTAVITGAFNEGGQANTLRAYVLTGNGTGSAPSVSSPVDMLPGQSGNIFYGASTVFDTNANKFVTVVGLGTNSYYAIVLTSTQSGTTFTVDSGQTNLQAQNIYYDQIVAAYSDHSNNVFIASNQNPNTYYRGVMFTAGSLGIDKVIGITAQAISNGASGTVNLLGGINESQSNLTIGTDYYVDASTGQLTADSSGNTFIGTAISGTTLNIKDL